MNKEYSQHFTLWRAKFGKPVNANITPESLKEDYTLEYVFPSSEFTTSDIMNYEAHQECALNIIDHICDTVGFRQGDLLVYGTRRIAWSALCTYKGALEKRHHRLNMKNSPEGLELVILP